MVDDEAKIRDTSTTVVSATVGWEWDIGDGSPKDSAQNVQQAYDQPGAFKVKLVITDQDGASDSVELTVVVIPNAA